MSVVENVFSRVYSKGARLFVDTNSLAATTLINETYIATLPAVAGVKSIKGPKMGRDVIDMNELDQVPPGLVGTTADLATSSPGINLATTPTETPEMYYNKIKAPGDKDIGPLVLSLNMTRVWYGKLHQLYIRDIAFLWLINLRTKPITPAGGGGGVNSRCFFIGFGFISELSMDVQSSALVTASCSIQPLFGVSFLSNCNSLSTLSNEYVNKLTAPAC